MPFQYAGSAWYKLLATSQVGDVGNTVLIKDLKSRDDLNYETGVIASALDPTTGRFGVRVHDETFNIKPENILFPWNSTPRTPCQIEYAKAYQVSMMLASHKCIAKIIDTYFPLFKGAENNEQSRFNQKIVTMANTLDPSNRLKKIDASGVLFSEHMALCLRDYVLSAFMMLAQKYELYDAIISHLNNHPQLKKKSPIKQAAFQVLSKNDLCLRDHQNELLTLRQGIKDLPDCDVAKISTFTKIFKDDVFQRFIQEFSKTHYYAKTLLPVLTTIFGSDLTVPGQTLSIGIGEGDLEFDALQCDNLSGCDPDKNLENVFQSKPNVSGFCFFNESVLSMKMLLYFKVIDTFLIFNWDALSEEDGETLSLDSKILFDQLAISSKPGSRMVFSFSRESIYCVCKQALLTKFEQHNIDLIHDFDHVFDDALSTPTPDVLLSQATCSIIKNNFFLVFQKKEEVSNTEPAPAYRL